MGLEIKQIIVTRLERRGDGEDDDPVRIIEQWWDMSSNSLLSYDPCKDELTFRGKTYCQQSIP